MMDAEEMRRSSDWDGFQWSHALTTGDARCNPMCPRCLGTGATEWAMDGPRWAMPLNECVCVTRWSATDVCEAEDCDCPKAHKCWSAPCYSDDGKTWLRRFGCMECEQYASARRRKPTIIGPVPIRRDRLSSVAGKWQARSRFRSGRGR